MFFTYEKEHILRKKLDTTDKKRKDSEKELIQLKKEIKQKQTSIERYRSQSRSIENQIISSRSLYKDAFKYSLKHVYNGDIDKMYGSHGILTTLDYEKEMIELYVSVLAKKAMTVVLDYLIQNYQQQQHDHQDNGQNNVKESKRMTEIDQIQRTRRNYRPLDELRRKWFNSDLFTICNLAQSNMKIYKHALYRLKPHKPPNVNANIIHLIPKSLISDQIIDLEEKIVNNYSQHTNCFKWKFWANLLDVYWNIKIEPVNPKLKCMLISEKEFIGAPCAESELSNHINNGFVAPITFK